MRVLGIDPGYDRLGIAIIDKKQGEKESLVYSHCFTTDKNIPYEKRLKHVGEEIERIIDVYTPTVCAVETLFLAKNQKTAMLVAGVRGVIIYIAEKNKLSLFEYSPLQIKTAVTGYGKSDKSQVTTMVRQLITIPDKEKRLDDEFDAIAVGLTCFAIEKFT